MGCSTKCFSGLANDERDYYKFTLTENGNVNLKLSGLTENAILSLLSSNGNQISQFTPFDKTDKTISQNLKAGTYYAYVYGTGNGTNYKLDASAISLGGIS